MKKQRGMSYVILLLILFGAGLATTTLRTQSWNISNTRMAQQMWMMLEVNAHAIHAYFKESGTLPATMTDLRSNGFVGNQEPPFGKFDLTSVAGPAVELRIISGGGSPVVLFDDRGNPYVLTIPQ